MKAYFSTYGNENGSLDGLSSFDAVFECESMGECQKKAYDWAVKNVDTSGMDEDDEGHPMRVVGVELLEEVDCWKVVYHAPTAEDLAGWHKELFGEWPDEEGPALGVANPGTHPGGNAWWVHLGVTVFGPVFGY